MATPNVTPTSTTPVRAKRQAKKPARYDDDAFVAHREESDWELALQFRRQGKINTPDKPFEEFDAAELNALLDFGVLKPVLYNRDEHSETRIFKSRMVREIKARTTPRPYEKSRLVVQGYGDDEKRGDWLRGGYEGPDCPGYFFFCFSLLLLFLPAPVLFEKKRVPSV